MGCQRHWMSRMLLLAAAAVLGLGAQAEANDKVTFVTDYGLYGRHAYYFVAIDKGYYAREGLDVDIVRSPGSADAIKEVANGTAQLGFADAFAVVLGRANDHIPVKIVAMIYPRPPHAIYVMKDSGITKPKDLEGKVLADTAFSSVPKLFNMYAKAAGIDATKVKWIIASNDALPGMLTQGRVDGIGQYTVGEPLLAKAAAPKQVLGLAYADAGLDYYSNGIVASDAMIKSNPDLIRRFVRGTLAGLTTAMANPQEAGEILHKYHREIDVDIAVGETEKVKELAVQPGKPLGTIERDRVQKTIDFAGAAYALKSTVTPDDLYASGFLPQ